MAMILSRPSATPLSESRGSRISALFKIKIIQVANPKHPSIPTMPPQIPNAILFDRVDIAVTVAHNPKSNTLTISTNAAHRSESSSVTNVIAPIASNTKQNTTGASPIYINNIPTMGNTIDKIPRATTTHRVQLEVFGDFR
jgi:hypothetical protein